MDERATDHAPEDLVRLFLRGQNLEQVERYDEAIELYEVAVAGGFDAIGPYDRLIVLYQGRDAHTEVVRIAEAALDNVRTHQEKRLWYRGIKEGAEQVLSSRPDAVGPEF